MGLGKEIQDLILVALAVIVMALFIGAIYAFIVAIFQFIFAKGDSEKIKKARNNIRYMLLGIILSMILLFIFPTALRLIKVPGYENYSAQNVFNTAGEIIRKLLEGEGTPGNMPGGPTSL